MENQKPTKEQLMFVYEAIGKLEDYALTRHLNTNTATFLDPIDHTVHFRAYDFTRPKDQVVIYDGAEFAIADSDAIAEECENVKNEINEYINRKYDSYADDDNE